MRIVDDSLIEQLYQQAAISERKRSHLLLHDSHQDKVQRVLIALVKGSYVEPHFHEQPHQWEMFQVVDGCIKVTIYNDSGDQIKEFLVGPESKNLVVEFSPNEIHSVKCISDKALMLEIKEGPFDLAFAKSFPKW